MRRLLKTGLAAASLLASATGADAHIIGARLGDFYAGVAHPLTDLQDVILWVALGLLAGSLGAAKARPLIFLFPAGLVAGLLIPANLGAGFEGALAAAGMLVVLGLLLALELRLHATALYAIVLALAVMRGAANAGGVGPETNQQLYAAGMAAAGYVTITLVMALTLAFRGEGAAVAGWRRIAVRALGSWIAAIGLMMAGLAFTH